MKTILLAAAVGALGLLPVASNAAVFEFAFTGTVQSTNLGDNTDVANIGALNAGDAVSGSFTYDGSGVVGGAGTFGQTNGAVSNFQITIDGFSYGASGTGSSFLYNNHMPGSAASVTDAFFASSSVTGPDQGGLMATFAQFSLGSIVDLSILSSLDAPTLSEFQNLIAANTFDGNTNFLVFENSEDVRFGLDSVTVAAVPLPAGGLLLLGGLAGLGALRRRQNKVQ